MRPPSSTENSGTERRREKKRGRGKPSNCDAPGAPHRPGQRSSGPSSALLLFSTLEPRPYACRLFSRDLGITRVPVPGDHEQQQLLQSRPVAENHSMEARLEQCPEQVSDERVTNALHVMQGHLQQITVISQRRSQKTLSEQAASRTKGNSACEAMEPASQAHV